MEEKLEPKSYFFDQKNPSYYKNEFLNNCKSRIRYIDKIQNNVLTIQNSLSQLVFLENKKDPHDKYDQNLDKIQEEMDLIIGFLEQYRLDVESEKTNLLSTDFEKVIESNVVNIRKSEELKNGKELKEE